MATTHATHVRVRYEETDQMGVVYHSNYLVYFEIGRTEFMRERGCPYAEIERQGFILTVVGIRCRYRSPARYDDLLRIRTRVESLRPVRITFAYEVLHDATGRLLAEGTSDMACLGRDGRPCRIPDFVLERLRN